MIRWWRVPTSKRFYVEGVHGYTIGGGSCPGTTWGVFDANNCHKEIACFAPQGGRSSDLCRYYAAMLCNDLNREEAEAI